MRDMRVSDERRRFFRHSYGVPIRLDLGNDRETGESAFCRDLSIGGLSFIWPERISRGKRLGIEIAVGKKRFEVSAKVAYSREESESSGYRTGVTFLDAPSAFRAKIAEEVLQILDFRKSASKELGYELSEEEATRRWLEGHLRGA